jgi:hypothetical protein
VTIDGERKNAAKKIIDGKKITLPVLLLLKEKTMDQYGVRGWMPQIFYVDQQGMMIGKTIGARNWEGTDTWLCLRELFDIK